MYILCSLESEMKNHRDTGQSNFSRNSGQILNASLWLVLILFLLQYRLQDRGQLENDQGQIILAESKTLLSPWGLYISERNAKQQYIFYIWSSYIHFTIVHPDNEISVLFLTHEDQPLWAQLLVRFCFLLGPGQTLVIFNCPLSRILQHYCVNWNLDE